MEIGASISVNEQRLDQSSSEPLILVVEDNMYSACALMSILDQYTLKYNYV